MESEKNFNTQNISEQFYNKDGKTITLEELKNGFLEMMVNSQKILELPKEITEQKIKFIIGAFLVDKKLFSRTKLGTEDAVNLINHLYEFFISRQITEEKKADPVFSKRQTESMIQQARKQQLGEKSHAKLCEEGEKDIYRQTVREFDKSREK